MTKQECWARYVKWNCTALSFRRCGSVEEADAWQIANDYWRAYQSLIP